MFGVYFVCCFVNMCFGSFKIFFFVFFVGNLYFFVMFLYSYSCLLFGFIMNGCFCVSKYFWFFCIIGIYICISMFFSDCFISWSVFIIWLCSGSGSFVVIWGFCMFVFRLLLFMGLFFIVDIDDLLFFLFIMLFLLIFIFLFLLFMFFLEFFMFLLFFVIILVSFWLFSSMCVVLFRLGLFKFWFLIVVL